MGENRLLRTFRSRRVARWGVRLALPLLLLLATVVGAWAIVTDLTLVNLLHDPQADHADQFELLALVKVGKEDAAFAKAFELGDQLFDAKFNALDGIGANVGQGQRFSRVPRADLAGPDEWANHVPRRDTGPNAESCIDCHNSPFESAAGEAASNVIRDPLHGANLGALINRSAPHLFASGAVQRLAEEMTIELRGRRARAIELACGREEPVTLRLLAQGVDFGRITVARVETSPCEVDIDTSAVVGVDPGLIIRPFQWKGSTSTVREFSRGESHNEIGMQPVELVGEGVDGDFDGVVDEMTVGDQTALAIYLAAQPRPTSLLELASLGLISPLPPEKVLSIRIGQDVFQKTGCASCHTPELVIENPIFSEPSRHQAYRDSVFPAGQDPVEMGLDPEYSVSFDLTQDQPDNVILDDSGNVMFRLGSLQTDTDGRAIVRLYGDLKRHDMGAGLAESIDEVGTGSAVFMTENLWGVGSTAPYLHDGRATTLTEAILEHGGEATSSRDNFLALPASEQQDLINFLKNLVLFKIVKERPSPYPPYP